jgi:hypothetical protein
LFAGNYHKDILSLSPFFLPISSQPASFTGRQETALSFTGRSWKEKRDEINLSWVTIL